jgi:CRISPR/Cas system-associated protein Cas10 (large subunit of type III CRISPR-Cas system)
MNDTKKRLLLGGDLSGIQKFIYNIASRKAAKSLKARSRYLQELMNNVVNERIINHQDIVSCEKEIICLSGGKFYLLLPDTKQIIAIIKNVKEQIDRELWDEHKGQLSLNIDYVSFSVSDDNYCFEGQSGTIGDLWKCLADKLTVAKNQRFKSLLCKEYDAFFEPEKFDKVVRVCAVTGIESDKCVRLDDKDSDSPFVLPSVKNMTTEKGDGKTFEDYADGTYLGILRLDVDNLGQLFIKGRKDFAEYKELSVWLNSFFEKNLYDISKNSEYKDFVNIIYAGGDDVFAVGRWDKLILFAHEVREKFRTYVGDKNITISGGMAIVGEKFPIAKAAEMAGEAEHKAKSLPDKNAFNLFGETFSWKDEYDYIKKWKDEFVRLCAAKEKPMPRSILHKVMRFAELLKAGDMKYAWHTIYFLKRFSENKSDAVKSFCDKLQKEVLSSKRNYELMAIAARWAELELRDKK